MTGRLLRVIALLLPLWPTLVLAQQPKAGVVTTLHGVATVARAAAPQETPLRFKDDVFYKDRISTKENSIVRVLLGGKALVTVRELSVLAINEEPNRATVDLQAGKIALAVARKLMRPGESIEVRTPNAIASVRGTVLIVEMIGATAIFNVITGSIAVSVPQAPSVPPVTVNAGQSVPVTGNTIGPIGAVTPTATQGLSAPPQVSGPPAETQQQVNNQQTGQATALAAVAVALLPQQPTGTTGGTYSSSSDSKPPSTSNVGVNESQTSTTVTTQQQSSPPPPPPPPPGPTNSLFLVQNATVQLSAPNSGATFSTGTTQQNPEPGAIICATPPCSPIAVTTPLLTATAPTGGSISVSGTGLPVLEIKDSSLSVSAPLFNVSGTTVETSTLLVMDPSSLTLGDSLLFMDSATLTSASTLFSATGDATGKSTITATGDGVPLVKLLSSTLRLTGAGKSLLSLDHSDLTVKGPFLSGTDSTVEVNGPLLNLLNGSTATNSVGPVIKLSGGSLMADALGISDSTGNKFDLTGTLLDLSNGASVTLRTLGEEVPNNHRDTVTFNLAAHEPLISLSSSHLTLTGAGEELVGFGVDTGTLITQNGVALIATGTSATPSTISLQGRLLDLGGVTLTDSQAQIQLSHTTVTQTGSDPLIDVLGLPVTVAGPLLYVGGGTNTITAGGPILHFGTGSFTSNTTDELIQIGAGDVVKSSSNFVRLDGGASVSLKGTFLNASGSTLCSGSTSTPCATGAPGNTAFMVVTGGAHLTQTGIPQADGSLLRPPLIVLSGGNVTAGGNFFHVIGAGSNVSLAGRLLSSSGTAITAGNNLVRLFDGGSLSSSTTDHLLLFTGGSFTGGGILNTASGGSLLRMFSQVGQPGTSLTLIGPYLGSSGGTTFLSRDASLFNITDGASINAGSDFALFGTGSATSAFSIFRLETNTSFTQPGQPTTVGSGAPATVNINGTLIGGANFMFTTQNGGDFLFLHDGVTLQQMGTKALVALDGTGLAPDAFAVNAAGRFLSMSADSPPPTLSLSGSLLSALNAKITTAGDFAALSDGATLTGSSNNALVSLSGSTVTAGTPGTDTHFLKIARSTSRVSLTGQGGLLSATGGSLTVKGDDFIEVRDGGRLEFTGTGSNSLVGLTNTSLATTESGCGGCPQAFLHLFGSNSNVSLGSHPLLSADTSPLTVKGDLVLISGGGNLTSTTSDSSPALVILTGGTHSIGGAIFNLAGSAPTDKPLQYGGPLFQASGATVTAQNGLKIDPALLEATAPLFKLLNGSQVTSAGDFVKLTDNSRVTANVPNDAFIRVDGSTLSVTSGALVKLDGSSIAITGDLVRVSGAGTLSVSGGGEGVLVRMNGGATLTITNGVLLNVLGGSTVTLDGALVKMTGPPGNTISVTNALTPTNLFGGIPVYIPSGSSATVTVTGNPLIGLNSNGSKIFINGTQLPNKPMLNSLTGSLIAVQGTGNTIRIGSN